MSAPYAAEMVELATRQWGAPTHSSRTEARFGTNGSKSIDLEKASYYDHEAKEGGGYRKLYKLVNGDFPENGHDKTEFYIPPGIVREHGPCVGWWDYHDESSAIVSRSVRFQHPGAIAKKFLQCRPLDGRWTWKVQGIEIPPYQLPLLRKAKPGSTVYITEGEKKADALIAWGLVATCSVGGSGKFLDHHAKALANFKCIVLPDNDDAGAAHKINVVQKLQAADCKDIRILTLPNLPPKGDIIDWIASGGTHAEFEKLVAEIPKPTAPDRGKAFGRLIVLGTKDIDTAEERGYLLKGLISPAEISIWVGPPKCGKSFLMLHIAYKLSLGLSVFGRRVKPTIVLYVAAEGEGGIAKRIKALRTRYGDSPNFHFIAQPADLLHKDGHLDEMKLAVAGTKAQLIVLDTLSRLMAGGDENAPGDMGMFVCNVTELRHDTNAHIAIIHHGTKSSNGSSPRGHSSLTGANDALIEVMKLEDGSRTATVVHAKDDADGMRWGFDLEGVELGTDKDDDPITTLIVNEKHEAPAAASKSAKLSNNETIAMRCFASAMKTSQTMATVGEDHAERAVIHEADWRNCFYREGMPGEEQNTRRVAYKRAVASLIAKGVIATIDDLVWQTRT